MDDNDNGRRLMPRKEFRERQGGVSLMAIWRRERSVEGYPKPVYINKRAYYWSDEVERYFASLSTTAPPSVKGAAA
jgi:hypothetical protein